jgi:hypothetical protein
MYEYNKMWYTFGIIKKIYYSKYYIVEFTNGTHKYLYECKLNDFKYNADIKAYLKANESDMNYTNLLIFDGYADYPEIDYPAPH